MAKEWILNIATNRWGLNKKNSVGPVASWIRECSPKNLSDWQQYYFNKLSEFLEGKGIEMGPKQYLIYLGQKLYIKITESIRAEIDEVTEEDCIEYIKNLVINRTFDGYLNELSTIYGYLENLLQIKIKPAPDEWDRIYNIDFFIEKGNKIIGLQIKPLTYEQLPEVHKWREWLSRTHEKFKREKRGEVFVIFTTTKDRRKIIYNSEVVDKIKEQLEAEE